MNSVREWRVQNGSDSHSHSLTDQRHECKHPTIDHSQIYALVYLASVISFPMAVVTEISALKHTCSIYTDTHIYSVVNIKRLEMGIERLAFDAIITKWISYRFSRTSCSKGINSTNSGSNVNSNSSSFQLHTRRTCKTTCSWFEYHGQITNMEYLHDKTTNEIGLVQ